MDGDGDGGLGGVETGTSAFVPPATGHSLVVGRADCGDVVLGEGFAGYAVLPARLKPVREPADEPEGAGRD
jgi:hypothetical protein